MKRIAALSLITISFFITANAESISWHRDFKKAKAIAQESAKPMLLDFTAKWCEPCRYMDEVFWTRRDIIELSKDFVCVKVNYDLSASLKRKYRIRAIPFVILIDSWGTELASYRGFGSSSFRTIPNGMKVVPKDFSEIRPARNTLEVDKKNLEALKKISGFYIEHKFYYQSNEFLEPMLKLLKDPAERENVMLDIGFNYLRATQPDKAKKYLNKFVKEFPASAQMDRALYGQYMMYRQKNSKKKAKKYLLQLRATYPNSKYANRQSGSLSTPE